jgi:hypothetical protein
MPTILCEINNFLAIVHAYENIRNLLGRNDKMLLYFIFNE